MLSLSWAWVQSPTGELRSCKPQGAAKKRGGGDCETALLVSVLSLILVETEAESLGKCILKVFMCQDSGVCCGREQFSYLSLGVGVGGGRLGKTFIPCSLIGPYLFL